MDMSAAAERFPSAHNRTPSAADGGGQFSWRSGQQERGLVRRCAQNPGEDDASADAVVVKTEEEVELMAVKIDEEAGLMEHSLKVAMELVLDCRSPDDIVVLLSRLLAQGITRPADLVTLSPDFIQRKLETLPEFSLGDVADVVRLREALGKDAAGIRSNTPTPVSGRQKPVGRRQRSAGGRQTSKGGRPTSKAGHRAPARAGRSRSRDPAPRAERGAPARSGRHRYPAPPAQPPLWDAVQQGDVDSVRDLVDGGHDVEERYQGWTPLMKAAEEGHVEIAELLLAKGADVGATNRTGRDALSFAACPSDAGHSGQRQKRLSQPEMIRLLVHHGADPDHKDDRGHTAKSRASKEERTDAVSVLEELEWRGT